MGEVRIKGCVLWLLIFSFYVYRQIKVKKGKVIFMQNFQEVLLLYYNDIYFWINAYTTYLNTLIS